ncbi:MAG: HipA N-terminal domain-containing protein [Clostridiales bacterium]|nr:HipA N-terminal domain-containing protein [Clostridiales bacterium]
MADTFQEIYVYMDHTDKASSFLGTLFVSNVRGKSTCAFSYDDKWLYENKAGISLDPDLSFYRSRQYVPAGKAIFGMFGDSCPDRWGRMLMDRREVIKARKEARRPRKLTEFDYLLGVYDE